MGKRGRGNSISLIAMPLQEGFKNLIFATKKDAYGFFGYSSPQSFNYRFDRGLQFYPVDKSGLYAESYELDELYEGGLTECRSL